MVDQLALTERQRPQENLEAQEAPSKPQHAQSPRGPRKAFLKLSAPSLRSWPPPHPCSSLLPFLSNPSLCHPKDLSKAIWTKTNPKVKPCNPTTVT